SCRDGPATDLPLRDERADTCRAARWFRSPCPPRDARNLPRPGVASAAPAPRRQRSGDRLSAAGTAARFQLLVTPASARNGRQRTDRQQTEARQTDRQRTARQQIMIDWTDSKLACDRRRFSPRLRGEFFVSPRLSFGIALQAYRTLSAVQRITQSREFFERQGLRPAGGIDTGAA